MPFDQIDYVPAPPQTAPHPAPTSSPVVRILQDARARIASPLHWAKESYGKETCNGMAYCAYGAVTAYFTIPGSTEMMNAICLLQELSGGIESFNDAYTTTHADVLALFDRAIAAAEALT